MLEICRRAGLQNVILREARSTPDRPTATATRLPSPVPYPFGASGRRKKSPVTALPAGAFDGRPVLRVGVGDFLASGKHGEKWSALPCEIGFTVGPVDIVLFVCL